MALIRPIPASADKTYLFAGYVHSTAAVGTNIPAPIEVADSNNVSVSSNVITFNKSISGTIKAKVLLTTGKTENYNLVVLKNNSVVLTGASVSGYENMILTVSGSISVSAGDTISVCLAASTESIENLDTYYVSII